MLLYPWSLCLDSMALICYNIDADGENFDSSFVVLSSNLLPLCEARTGGMVGERYASILGLVKSSLCQM